MKESKMSLSQKFQEVRSATEIICSPLEVEDYSCQPVDFVSPPKWHLGHTSWFFEEFILTKFVPEYVPFDRSFFYLFNSYYNSSGERIDRCKRGNLTRPTVAQVLAYRDAITAAMEKVLAENPSDQIQQLTTLGLNHEQQHQELLAYDIKYILGHQPTFPSYGTALTLPEESKAGEWISVAEGVYEIGHSEDSFCYDNELNVHKTFLHPYAVNSRLVTNGEYLEFVESGGYRDFTHWHAEGWDWVLQNQVQCPEYWHKKGGEWFCYTLGGLTKLPLDKPVMHISFFEAHAYAHWRGARLPTEAEWEIASPNFPHALLWEWTESAYLPYPNYKRKQGALGEYNGKFMVNQKVLRGGSFATPEGHGRRSYRNFFHPQMRWMFSGIRLARSLSE